MMDDETFQRTRTRFLMGVLLAWVPFLLFVVPVLNAFRGVATSKATGLDAVAGGLTEGLATFGFAALVIAEVSAIVLLARNFSRVSGLRSFVSAASICCSLLMMAIMGIFVWLTVYLRSLPR
jgi:hypothetical protein